MPVYTDFLTSMEVAQKLGLHINTVRRWSDLGILPCYRFGPRHDRRYDPNQIQKFIDQNKFEAN